MLRRGRYLEFDAPDGWAESHEGGSVLFQGPNGEELLLSSTFVDGEGAPDESARLRDQLVKNALQAASDAAVQEGLLPVRPFAPQTGLTELPCWTFASETAERDVSFMGAVVTMEAGVLLATLEAPCESKSERVFREFVASVRAPAAEELP